MDFDFDILRLLAAFCVGYFISVSGSLSQILTANPIASTSTLGIDGVSVLIVLLTQFFLTILDVNLPLEYLAIFFSAVILVILWQLKASESLFAKTIRRQLTDTKSMVLIGIGINLLVASIFSIMQFIFMAYNRDFPTALWFGNFRYVSLDMAILVLNIFLMSYYYLYKTAHHYALLATGDMLALSNGVNVLKMRGMGYMFIFILTCVTTSLFGVFSFLGLIVPHLLRKIPKIKQSVENELLLGPFIAGLGMSTFDFICYNFTIQGAELPVGMLSSVIGPLVLLIFIYKASARNL